MAGIAGSIMVTGRPGRRRAEGRTFARQGTFCLCGAAEEIEAERSGAVLFAGDGRSS